MTREEAIKIATGLRVDFKCESNTMVDFCNTIIQALEQQPKSIEKFDDVKTHIQRLAGDYKCWDNRLTWEEALELNRMLEAQPCEDCISDKRRKLDE